MRHPDQCCNKVVVGTLTPLLSIILSFKRLRCYEASRSVSGELYFPESLMMMIVVVC